ncbi:MAG: TonB-dependent receptor [Henriciella sp.]|nr:TonB-dependent receptor [Henriciella sp.]
MDYKIVIRASASFGALMVFAAGAHGQDAIVGENAESENTEMKRLPNVTVTGERRETSLLDTPVAISAFTSEDRDNLGILDANDIADFTPGMTYQVSPNRITIRGIGRLDNALGTDPGVATYIDGAYTPDALTLDRSPLFVERIEVLRGPQGTLFGRNAIGGLINLISKRPQFEPENEVRIRLGKFEAIDGAFTSSGPLFSSDTTAYRINLHANFQGEGRYDNTASGTSEIASDDEQYSIDLQLTHNFSDRLSVWGRYRTEFIDGTAVTDRRTEAYDFRAPAAPALTYLGALTPNVLYGLNDTNPSVGDPLAQSLDFAGRTRFEDIHEFNWEVEWNTDLFDIKYLGSNYRRSFDYAADADGTARASHTLSTTDPTGADPFGTVTTTFHVNEIGDDLETSSHELQFLSNGDGAVQWIAGLYYYEENSEQPFALNLPQAVDAGTPQIFDFTLNTGACFFGFAPDYICGLGGAPGEANPDNSYYFQTGILDSQAIAAYGQVDWEFAPGWSAKLGLRYTEDEKKGFEEQNVYAFDPNGAFGAGAGIGAPIQWIQLTPNDNTRTFENQWDALTGTAGLSREFGQDGLMYAQYTRGYKSGGMRLGQLTPDDPTTPQDERFVDEELVDAYEIGAKAQNAEGTVQFAASVFYYDYQDQQAPVNFVNDGGIVQQLIVNVPESRTAGLEIEAQWLPTEALQLGFNYGYLDTEIESFGTLLINDALGVTESVEGSTLPRSPEHSLTAFAGYTFELADSGDLTLLGDWTYTDDLHNTLFDDPVYTIESNDILNLRAIWTNERGDWTIIGSVSNVFDEDVPDSVTVSTPELGFVRLEQFVSQRNFFIELQKRF